ncbi:hypothetical protein D778_02575 [Xanthomarina gelatinilytica]|uniref:DUF5777 domain-containing protein n=1 Tax=Xanthomarina gelatinilytica TaxID=1137281 RepID=M7MK69_9FLAO|nr:DUF5777 family beta-barrel protein [Xanthomarina gelatinilytica]EMQ95481.1 hypothetical protein D778_02575 [Xanthomarina gelatinilytica]
MYNRILLIIVLFVFGSQIKAQVNLLDSLDMAQNDRTTNTAFKGLQIVNLQSTKMINKGDFYFLVSHRFGSLDDGVNTFFGLDNANTKIGAIYGVKNWLALGLSRHTLNKVYEGTVKYRISTQNQKMPVTLVGYHSLQINSQIDKDTYPDLSFQNRLTYVSEILISRAFSKKLSLELVGAFIYKNLYNPQIENQKQLSVGAGGRFKLSKRLSLNAEYLYANRPSFYNNPLSLGLDIETGGHVFQLLFTNSQAMTESEYLTNATGDWTKGEIYFGFNLYRVF